MNKSIIPCVSMSFLRLSAFGGKAGIQFLLQHDKYRPSEFEEACLLSKYMDPRLFTYVGRRGDDNIQIVRLGDLKSYSTSFPLPVRHGINPGKESSSYPSMADTTLPSSKNINFIRVPVVGLL